MDKPLAWNEWTRAMQVALYNATKRRKALNVVHHDEFLPGDDSSEFANLIAKTANEDLP